MTSTKKPHTIVIGSGAGGLSTAVFLARAGHRVTVLEKHFIPGGCLQCFTRKGIKFDTGMHFIGSYRPGENLHNLWTSLGIADDIPVSDLDPEGYNTLRINGENFKIASGREAWIESLGSRFPSQKDALTRYYNAVRSVASASIIKGSLPGPEQLDILAHYHSVSINGFIDSLISDSLLRDVLVGDLPLHAPRRDVTPFAQHAFITDFYNRSAGRVTGGSDRIATSLIRRLRQLDGEILLSAPATRIITSGCVAKGVEVNHDRFIQADYVVGDIHPSLILDMTDKGTLRPAFRQRIKSLENSIGAFTVYMSFKPGTVPYERTNHFVYPDNISPWQSEEYTSDTWPRGYMLMHQASEEALTTGFARSAIAISYMRCEDTLRWAHLPAGHRGLEYETFKQIHARRLLDCLIRDFPALEGCIDDIYISTPATFQSYTATPGGSMYGIMKDIRAGAAGRVPYRTRIPNLFLTGQNVNAHGILGVSVGAFMTACQFVNPQKMLSILNSPFDK